MSGERPSCYGLSWNTKDKICSGGTDPSYYDAETNSHVRPRCAWFGSCSSATQLRGQNKAREKLTVLQDTPSFSAPAYRPALAPIQAQVANQQSAEAVQSQAAWLQATRAITAAQQQLVQPSPVGQQQQPVMWSVQQSIPVNYQMPGYLTTPEQRSNNDSYFGVLIRELFRSTAKSFGHALSHYFDRERLK